MERNRTTTTGQIQASLIYNSPKATLCVLPPKFRSLDLRGNSFQLCIRHSHVSAASERTKHAKALRAPVASIVRNSNRNVPTIATPRRGADTQVCIADFNAIRWLMRLRCACSQLRPKVHLLLQRRRNLDLSAKRSHPRP